MRKYIIIFVILAAALTIIAVVSTDKKKPVTKIPTFNLISAVPFDLKPNSALLADDNLILYGENGAYITSYDNPIVNEETKFIGGNINDIFYDNKSKKLFIDENKKYIHIYDLDNNTPVFFNKISMNDSRGEVGFVADDLGNIYIAEAYKVHKYSLANGAWKTFKIGLPDPDMDGSIQTINVIDGNIVIGQANRRGGETSGILNEKTGGLIQIKVEERDSYIDPIYYKAGRYFVLSGHCYCEINLTDNNIEFVRYFNNLITGSFGDTLINGNTLIGFYEDNSYELFDINSSLKKVPPFATGTLSFITSQYESIVDVFNTKNQNEFIVITIDNTSIGGIYKVKLEI